MTPHPYAPPKAPLAEPTISPKQLYTAGQVAGATFLGGPIAGAWLMARNYVELGQRSSRPRILVTGVILTALLILVSFSLPENAPAGGLPLLTTLLMYQTTRMTQGAKLDEHADALGLKPSNWKVAGISVIGLLVTATAIGAVSAAVALAPMFSYLIRSTK